MKKIVLLAFVSILLSTTVFMGFVRPVAAQETIYVRADGSVDPPTAPISNIDNATYTFTDNINCPIVVKRDNIVVDGVGYTLQGTGSGKGIDLRGRSNVTIKNTKIKAFNDGIYLHGASSNSIYGNNITNNTRGIWLNMSSNNTIYGNNITHNKVGAWLRSSSNNTIYGNNITHNYYYGVRLEYSSSNNTIYGNNITHNYYYGVWLYDSVSNKFYHNNFIDNTRHAYIATLDCANFWDAGYSSGGNYWSNYTDVDQYSGLYQNETGSDGIFDHPYVIDENNIDRYPIVPEFLTWTSMLIMLIILTVVTAIYKRRLLKTPIH